MALKPAETRSPMEASVLPLATSSARRKGERLSGTFEEAEIGTRGDSLLASFEVPEVYSWTVSETSVAKYTSVRWAM